MTRMVIEVTLDEAALASYNDDGHQGMPHEISADLADWDANDLRCALNEELVDLSIEGVEV